MDDMNHSFEFRYRRSRNTCFRSSGGFPSEMQQVRAGQTRVDKSRCFRERGSCRICLGSVLRRCPRSSTTAILVALLMAANGGCRSRPPEDGPPPARPVSVLELKKMDMRQQLRVTGTCQAWRAEDIGFEVRGRVTEMIESGRYVEGPKYDAHGRLMEPGALLGKIDAAVYRAQWDEAAAQVSAADAKAEALKVQVDEVLPEQLRAARALLEQSTNEYERVRDLAGRGAASQSELDAARADYQSKTAEAARLTASIRSLEADLKAVQAERARSEAASARAEINLRFCELRAPFSGQVARVNVVTGGYVQPGAPVIRLVVMDPMKVELNVSADRDRQLTVGDIRPVVVRGREEPVLGFVYLKDTVADPNTHTFKVTIMMRNWKVPVGASPEPGEADLPSIERLFPVVRPVPGGEGPLYVRVESLDNDESSVWQAVDAESEGQPVSGAVLRLKKVPVELGDDVQDVGGLFRFRELTDAGGLVEGSMTALDVPPGFPDGGLAVRRAERWLCQPGDLVEVQLDAHQAEPGLYVPMRAILRGGGDYHLFVVDRSNPERAVAKKVNVRLLGAVGEWQRIEPVDDLSLEEGSELILDGTHFLEPGQPVTVTQHEELRL
jgi:multidrug efflux pump subunit AcrA (membrane-fusion protein)